MTYRRFIALNTTRVPSGDTVGQRISRARTVSPSTSAASTVAQSGAVKPSWHRSRLDAA